MPSHEIWTTIRILTWTKEFLLSKGIVNGRLEAEWLLCSAMNLDRVGLYLQYDKPLNNSELESYRKMVLRRAKREPLQHILGSQEFYGIEYDVSSAVLVPRYDTEILVSESLKRLSEECSVLDVGTGSGCIAITLQKHRLHAVVTATDISEAALHVARSNAIKLGTSIEFLCGNLFVPVSDRRFDMIVSNPPYIPTAEIECLEQEVRDFDPRDALDGGSDGLDIYRSLIPNAVYHLNPVGWLIVEIGIDQARDVEQLFKNVASYTNVFIARDSNGIERVVGGQLKEMV